MTTDVPAEFDRLSGHGLVDVRVAGRPGRERGIVYTVLARRAG